jgi:5'-nucleotidase
MGKRVYEDRVELRHDPWGRPYYWQGGARVVSTDESETDIGTIRKGMVSITPLTLDWTNHSAVAHLAAEMGKLKR